MAPMRRPKSRSSTAWRKYPKRAYSKKKYAGRSGSRYATKFTRLDKFSTLSNSPSPSPVQLRAGQGSYSRGAYARAAVLSDLEIKNVDNNTLLWVTMAAGPGAGSATVTGTNAYINASGSLNIIAQGSTANQREGRKVIVKGIESRFIFTLASTATAANTTNDCRLITVLDKQANGAAFLEAILFETAGLGTNNLYSMANAQRFQILSDETFTLNAQASVGGNSVAPSTTKVVKLTTNIPLEFGSNAGTISDLRSNNLVHVLLVSGTGSVTANGTSRVYFVG